MSVNDENLIDISYINADIFERESNLFETVQSKIFFKFRI